MKFQAKWSVFIVLMLGALFFCPCQAQETFPKAPFYSAPLSINNSQPALSYSPILSFSRSTVVGNIEFSLQYQSSDFQYNTNKPLIGLVKPEQSGLLPQITLFSNQTPSPNEFQLAENKVKPVRYDRYKDTIPVIYRLTLKGYSIMEHSDSQTDMWSLDKVKDRPFKNSEILFSITKSF